MEPNQTYKLLHSKGNHKQNENTTCELRKSICKQCNQQGLNLQNIKVVHTIQYQKNQTTQSKNVQRFK